MIDEYLRIKYVNNSENNYNIKPKKKHHICEKCGCEQYTDKAHMLSKNLAKIIIIRQTKKYETTSELKLLDKLVKRLRCRAGDLILCRKCHRKSDDEQDVMVELLKGGLYGNQI